MPRNLFMFSVSLFVTYLLWSNLATAQTNRENVDRKIDDLFAQWNKSDSPGCSLGVSREGVTVYERGYGMANLELGVLNTPASVFHVASVSKPFTAMSIMLLAQSGRVSLDDEVSKYIKEFPHYGSRLTIRQLLSHTGGLRDVFLLQGLAASYKPSDEPNDQFVDILARQRGLNFIPGTEYQYSNGGYLLLATIVKRVTGQSLRVFADTNIFKPLGMTDTQFHDDPSALLPNRAAGYSKSNGNVRVAIRADPGGIVGNAGLYTTTRDLLRWQQNFADLRVGQRALLTAMETPTIVAGVAAPYSLGLEIGEYRGVRTIGHSGGNDGYVARMVRYPEQRLAIALLCNEDDIDVVGLVNSVADIYLSNTLAPRSSEVITATHVSLTAEQLASKEGLYRDPSTEQLLRLFVREGKLRATLGVSTNGGWELTPTSQTRFTFLGGAVALQFLPAAKGRVPQIQVTDQERPKPFLIEKVNPSSPSRRELTAFAGEYRSSELDVTYKLSVRDSALVIQIPGSAEIIAQPVFPDAFAGETVGVIKFLRDAHGVITGFNLNTSGVRNLHFDRVKPCVGL